MKNSQEKLETAYNIMAEVDTMLHTLKTTDGRLDPAHLEHMCDIICRRQSSAQTLVGEVSGSLPADQAA